MIDLYSSEFRRNPFPIYKQLRERGPVLHEPASGAWLLLDYESVNAAVNDSQRFSSDMRYAARGNPDWIIFMDPPRQTKLRGLVSKAFTAKVVAELEPRIQMLANGLLDDVAEAGAMDLVAQFATPLPMMVIAELIGIPAAEWVRFRRWSDSILKLSHTMQAGAAANAAVMEYGAVKAELSLYAMELIEERRSAPKDDLLTRLVQADVDGEQLGEGEIIGFIEVLIVAGQETTSNLISNAMVCLSANPDQRRALEERPELWPAAIEEVLRYSSPVQWLFRATTCDVEVQGVTIPAGKLVLPVLGSANRDERVFADADRFDIARNPNAHIAFGHGGHFCIGAPLARLEARIALPALLERLKGIEVADDAWEPRDALHVHGPARLPVRFAAGKRAVSVAV